jgi:hypothetical protein
MLYLITVIKLHNMALIKNNYKFSLRVYYFDKMGSNTTVNHKLKAR